MPGKILANASSLLHHILNVFNLVQAQPISVWTMLNQTVDRNPDGIALAVKRKDKWEKWTYQQYRDDIITVAKAFIKLGLKPFHSGTIHKHHVKSRGFS